MYGFAGYGFNIYASGSLFASFRPQVLASITLKSYYNGILELYQNERKPILKQYERGFTLLADKPKVTN